MYRANISSDKKLAIGETRSYLEALKVLLRLSKDLHVISLEKFLILIQSVETISKQLVGREKSVK
ncbi:TPA: hypothetical protein DEP21_01920 [Patescibacteria group bacterium]|nr:hypothetical protein [Candidatus Gracilibacteria bacterium]